MILTRFQLNLWSNEVIQFNSNSIQWNRKTSINSIPIPMHQNEISTFWLDSILIWFLCLKSFHFNFNSIFQFSQWFGFNSNSMHARIVRSLEIQFPFQCVEITLDINFGTYQIHLTFPFANNSFSGIWEINQSLLPDNIYMTTLRLLWPFKIYLFKTYLILNTYQVGKI